MSEKTIDYLNGIYFDKPFENAPAAKRGQLSIPTNKESVEKLCSQIAAMASWARDTNRNYLRIELWENEDKRNGGTKIDFKRSEYLSKNEIAAGQGQQSGTPSFTNTQSSGEPTTAKVGWSAKTDWDANG